ncbi:hypothetical protein [Marinobacterium sedimentorum]|nr:hypothetical protein [Marinobacterium sedimentorum]
MAKRLRREYGAIKALDEWILFRDFFWQLCESVDAGTAALQRCCYAP